MEPTNAGPPATKALEMSGESAAARVGLEIHVQLATASKLFSPAPTGHATPNHGVADPCWGLPGALPVLNHEAVEHGLRVALALECQVASVVPFDRKHYTYPDLPKGYQITQERTPLATGGRLYFEVDGTEEILPIARLHLEEDAGRKDDGGIDLNRAGVALIEIVTPPALRSGKHAAAAVRELQALLRTLGASEASPEAGHLRADANVSLRSPGAARCEIKNVSGFNTLGAAIDAEIARQIQIGGAAHPETRAWDAKARATFLLRPKESGTDYRFLPEPDVPPVRLDADAVAHLRATLGELPRERRVRWTEAGVAPRTAAQLAQEPALADMLDRVVKAGGSAGPAAEFVRGPVAERAEARDRPGIAEAVAEILRLNGLSSTRRKALLDAWLERGEPPSEAQTRLGPEVTDDEALRAWARRVCDAHPEEVARYRRGKRGILGFLVGQALKLSGGTADPRQMRELLEQVLDEA